ncbi:MAG: hypothetical protein LBR53_02465 [Deltaproteobacteria bacterium]|nr:hypothetical protein [Deltaproteobacteria bacterium]
MVEIDLKETSISIGENIFGGYLDEGDNATIQNNTVVINFGGTATFTGTDQKIAGALGTHSGGGVRNSTYEGNSATINGGTVNASVYGAINSFANAEAEANTYKGNQAVITGGTVRGDVVGASMAYYGRFEKGSPNKAEINAAENVSVDGNVYGVQIEYIGEAKFGLVNITGAAGKSVSITGDVAGAFVGSTTPTNIARASENTVNIDGSAAEIDITGSVLGGKVMASSGGGDTNAAAVNNVVNITGIKTADGDSLGDISGGYVGQTGTSVAGDTFFATGNRVNITDSDISSNVTGGYIYAIGAGGAGAYSATGNTVTLAGTVNVSGAPVLSGGLIDDAGSITGPEDAFTGNELVLNMAKVSGKFGTIQNFASYRFMVNTDDAAAPLLQTANLNLTDGTNNATMNISSVYGETVAIPGASVTLIQSDAAPTTTGTFSGTGTANHGTLFVYTYDLALDGNNVVATVASIGINAKSEGIVKTPLADVSFLNQGADQLADSAISAARTSLIGSQGYAVYGVLGYSKYRYETGSHVDVKGLTGQLGVSVGTDTGTTSGLGAVFFEFGRGTYDTYDEFPIVGEYHAYGDLTYVGGGVFGRLDLGSEFQSRPYFEASARLGKSWFNYQTDEFGDILVDNHEFNFDGKYYGFHAGAGYILNVDQLGTTFDLSSKFFYLEREAADHDFLGEHIHFDKTESSRLRTGGRVSIAVNDRIKPFVGGYYEYEFKGDAGVTIRNVQLAGDKLKGGSGIGELGVSLESLSTPIKFELGLQGSGGKRTGLGGTMSLSYAF